VTSLGLNGKCDIIQCGKILEHTRDLEGAGQSQGTSAVFWKLGNVLILEKNTSGIRSEGSRKLGDQGGFPGPVGPNYGVYLSFFNLHGKLADCNQASKGFGQLLGFE
jgi:hypothetical protein